MAMSRTRKTVLIIIGVVVALGLVVVISAALLLAALRQSAPPVRDNSVLALRVGGPLPDYVPDDPLRKYFGGTDEVA